jgi:hypothetical protein
MAYAPRPEHIFIGNHTYQVEWLSQNEWEDRRLDEHADALTHARHQLIQIRTYAPSRESHYQEVLFHELTHAVWDSTMLTHADLSAQEDPEEFVIGLQSPQLLFILKQNPDLVKWLMSDGTVVR